MTYTLCKKIITSGKYVNEDMLTKLDVFLLNDRIAQEQYNELVSMINAE